MNKRALIDMCLTLPGAYEDYPFDEVTAVLRHARNKKMFALVAQREGRLCVNLKCDPDESGQLRHSYEDIIPGWHMNKELWNTVYLNGDVAEDLLEHLIEESFELTRPRGGLASLDRISSR